MEEEARIVHGLSERIIQQHKGKVQMTTLLQYQRTLREPPQPGPSTTELAQPETVIGTRTPALAEIALGTINATRTADAHEDDDDMEMVAEEDDGDNAVDTEED
jgi:hypothetical protein